ncbi:MAG: YhjD/YihY/BrkB family envelope integrity protein [Acidobacteriota bacterium]
MSFRPAKIDDRVRNQLTDSERGRGAFTSFLRLFYVLASSFFDEEISLMAAGLVYTTLLSLVPLLAVAFSVLKAFGVSTKLEIMLYYFLEPLGEKGVDISMTVISFVEHMNVAVLGVVGLVTLLYTVVSTLSKIESALNAIWHVKETRPISQRFSAYLSIVLVGPVLVFTAMSLIVSLKSASVVEWILTLPGIGPLVYLAGRIFPYLLASVAFTLIYIFMPHTRVRLRPALAGGFFAAVSWGVIGWAFASFVATSSRYSAIYSGLAALFLFLIWIYWNWVALLAGAKVAFIHQHPSYFRFEKGTAATESFRERTALRTLALIGQSYYSGGKPPDAGSLSSAVGVPAPFLQDILSSLLQGGVLTATAGSPPAYLFPRDPGTISLHTVFVSLRQETASFISKSEGDSYDPEIEPVMKDIEAAIASALGNKTVKNLVETSHRKRPDEHS